MFDEILNRRQVVLGATALASSTVGFATKGLAAGGITAFYISASDCPFCREFEANSLSQFIAAAKAKGFAYRRVNVRTLRNISDPSDWPADLQSIRAQLREGGTPHFLLVKDGQIIDERRGSSAGKSMVGL